MLVDFGLIRFLTKVAEKSPRGLKLVLFKEKNTGNEKMVFIVKTSSEDLDKLALSKMTWQVEQSKASVKVIIVRLLILPDGAKDFFRSETGLLITEQKDYKCLQALYNQKSVEIYFFSYDNEFHSKIELLTTPTMANNVKVLLDKNPFIDESKLIVKSENLSQKDIQDAISGKVKDATLKDKDILEALQKKMPTMSSTSSAPKTKPEEFSKASIKSNDIKTSSSANIFKPEIKQENISKKDNLIKNENITPKEKIKEDNILDVINSIPPTSGLSASDLLNVISGANDVLSTAKEKIREDNILDVINSIPPTSGLSASDLLSSISQDEKIDLKSELSKDDLLKSIGDDKNSDLSILFSQEENEFFEDNTPTINLKMTNTQPNNVLSTLNNEKINNLDNVFDNEANKFFEENAPTILSDIEDKKVIDNSSSNEINADDLLLALMAEPSPIKEQENILLSDLLAQDSPLKSNPYLIKEIENNVKIVKPTGNTTIPPNKNSSINANDLSKTLNNDK
ncbi:MAG: hypothetical protein KatS3mg068_0148 [Candidatus Sericytochromatia bacterium]|nr:MAG: hypothetical protein KatS3mg068_0148 [Candidatus Sericytochromatia bacterium]